MHDQVLTVVLASCELLNEQLQTPIAIELGEQAPLFGRAGVIDSLGLVNLIVLTEEAVTETFGATITLADEETLADEAGVFDTVGSLTSYILEALEARD